MNVDLIIVELIVDSKKALFKSSFLLEWWHVKRNYGN